MSGHCAGRVWQVNVSFQMNGDLVLKPVVTVRCPVCGVVVQQRLVDVDMRGAIAGAIAAGVAAAIGGAAGHVVGADCRLPIDDCRLREGNPGGAPGSAGPGPDADGVMDTPASVEGEVAARERSKKKALGCDGCRHLFELSTCDPCFTCLLDSLFSKWEAGEASAAGLERLENVLHKSYPAPVGVDCHTCVHLEKRLVEEPCSGCAYWSEVEGQVRYRFYSVRDGESGIGGGGREPSARDVVAGLFVDFGWRV